MTPRTTPLPEWLRLEAILARLDGGFAQNEFVRLVGEDLIISPVRGEDPPASAEQLRDQVTTRLPKLDLPDLLIEVDRWTGFSRSFQHAGGAEPRTRDLATHLYAAIFAQACNFGLDQMAELAGLSYRKLAWCATWYLREDTLKAAISQVINFQHRQLRLKQRRQVRLHVQGAANELEDSLVPWVQSHRKKEHSMFRLRFTLSYTRDRLSAPSTLAFATSMN